MVFSKRKTILRPRFGWAAFIIAALTPLSSAAYEGKAQSADPQAMISEQRQAGKNKQKQLAKSSGAVLQIIEQGQTHTTDMIRIPSEVSAIVINDRKDLDVLIETLRPFYGLNEDDELRYVDEDEIPYSIKSSDSQTLYPVRQYIRGIETPAYLRIWVDVASGKVKSIDGYVYNSENIERRHRMNEETAVEQVLNYLEAPGKNNSSGTGKGYLSSMTDEAFVHNRFGNHEVIAEYRTFGGTNNLRVWWAVGIQLNEPVETSTGEVRYEWFFVDPKGHVSPYVVGNTLNHHQAQEIYNVCDGANTSTVFCSSGGSTVIDASGQCLDSGKCGTYPNPYREAYDTAGEVNGMWNDLLPASDNWIGELNHEYGADVEIKINGSALGTAAGLYRARILGRQNNRSAGMIIGEYVDVPLIVAHEMGHGFHGLQNWISFSKQAENLFSPNQYEHLAVQEYIGEINSVIFRNFNGPGTSPRFSSSFSFVTAGGKNLSQQYAYNNMIGGCCVGNEYDNARVGGHAFYELTQSSAVNYVAAAKLFLGGVKEMDDDDKNSWFSFAEARDGMLKYAIGKNYSAAVVDAIRNAWADVEVGTAGGFGPDQGSDTGPIGGGSTAPGPVISFSAQAIQSCSGGYSYYDISYQPVTGATYYEYWYRAQLTGTTWQKSFASTRNPAEAKNSVAVDVKMKACNGAGCSALSTQAVQLTYFCW